MWGEKSFARERARARESESERERERERARARERAKERESDSLTLVHNTRRAKNRVYGFGSRPTFLTQK